MNTPLVLAADPPKWTDVGQFWTTLAAAIGAAIAAVYAARAFQLQNREAKKQKDQIADLTHREHLSDRILRYQAYLNARAVVDGVEVKLSGGDTQIHVQIMNNSNTAVRNLDVQVVLDGTPLKLTGETNLLRHAAGWSNQGGPREPSSKTPTLMVGEGRIWDWLSETATSTDAVTVELQLTDMVGGRWTFDGTGAAQLLDD